MKKAIPLLASVAVELCLAAPLVAATARTATEGFVTNKIAAAISQIPPPDFSTNNAALVETIEAKAPTPGNYAAISNAAMNALSRVEAGLSAWSLTPNPQAPWSIQYEVANGLHAGGWFLVIDSQRVGFYEGEATATTILFADYTATRTRLPTMADIPTEQINAATTTNAQQTAAIESNRVAIASNSAAIDGKADRSDTVLSDNSGFTEWSIAHTPLSAEAKRMFFDESADAAANDYAVTIRSNGSSLYVGDYFAAGLSLSSDGLRCAFLNGSNAADDVWGLSGTTVATREQLQGYVLGLQTDKPLASEAEVKEVRQVNVQQSAAIESNRVEIASNSTAIAELTDTTSTLNDSISTIDANKADRSELAGYATPADVYRIVAGTNVILVVTNYNSTVHAPSMKLQHLDPETGEYVTYWDEARGHGITLTNAMDYADGVAARLDAAKAPRAWSRVTSGLGADAPEGTTFISTPVTHISGGFEFEKKITAGGTVWTLCSTSLAAGSTTNGFFEISALDGTPVFSVEKTDSVLVGVNASAIAVVDNACVISVPAGADTHPFARVATTLVNPTWYKETEEGMPAGAPASVTWSGQSGAWVATVDFGATPQGFVFFEYLQEGGVKIVNSAVVDLSQGVHYGGATYRPTVSGNELKFIRQ